MGSVWHEPEDAPLFCWWAPSGICKPIPQTVYMCTREISYHISEGQWLPPPKPSTETLVQSMSNKVRTGMYRLGSHIHSGYRMNFSWLPGSCPSWCPPSFLITISPFLWPIKLSVNQESRRFSVLLFPLYGFRWLTCIEILWVLNEIIHVIWTAQSVPDL